MWHFVVWFLGLFRKRSKKIKWYLDPNEYPPTDTFYQFMADVHDEIHRQHQEELKKRGIDVFEKPPADPTGGDH